MTGSDPRRGGSSWKKLGDSVGAKAAAVVVIAIAAWWTYASWDQPTAGLSPESRDAPLQVVTSFGGVRLGQELDSVASTHGTFDKEAARPDALKKYADMETYRQRNGPLRLWVRDGVVLSIVYACKEGRDPAAVNNVACHDFEDRIRNVFGDRVRVLCAVVKPDDPNKVIAPHVRAYDAVEYGTRYIVIRDKVDGFIVTDTKELDSLVGFNWVKCG